MSLRNKYHMSVWCRVSILLQLFKGNPSNGLWVGKVPMALSFVLPEWFYTMRVWQYNMEKNCLNFRWSCYYPERKPDFEMYSSWDSEHYGFPKNCMVDFMVRCINDNRKLCKNRSTHKQQEQNLFWNKASKSNFMILNNNHKNDILCSHKFTREKDQSFDYW